jgi:hypothetical protein
MSRAVVHSLQKQSGRLKQAGRMNFALPPFDREAWYQGQI